MARNYVRRANRILGRVLAGTKLGPYEILSFLGAGGMGEVYRALDVRLDRTVAIKILTAGEAEDSTAGARFEREAKTNLTCSGLANRQFDGMTRYCSSFPSGIS